MTDRVGLAFGFFTAKEGTMNPQLWLELVLIVLRIVSAGLSS